MLSAHNNLPANTTSCHMVSPERTKQRSSKLPLYIDIQDLVKEDSESQSSPGLLSLVNRLLPALQVSLLKHLNQNSNNGFFSKDEKNT